MSFGAGSVTGDLILGIDGWTQPFLQVEHLAETFPGMMEEYLGQPLRELGDMATLAGGSVARSFAELGPGTQKFADDFQRTVEQQLARPLHELGDVAEQTGGSMVGRFAEIDSAAANSAEGFHATVDQHLAQPLRDLGDLAEQTGGSISENLETIGSAAGKSGDAVQDAGQKMSGGLKQGAAGAHEAGRASEEMGHSILRSMLEAHAMMELFPDWVATFWANPMLGIADLARETGNALVEAFNSVTEDALDTELAAEKLGVSVEFFSKWAGVARTVKIESDQLSTGMFMLSRIVGEELANPTKELTRAFDLLGISQAWLNTNSNDTEAIFNRVREGLDAMTSSGQRNWVIQELMSRGARDLIPLFNLQKDHVNALMTAQERYGDVVTASEAKAARDFQDLKVQAQEAFEGIEKAASVPVLQFFVAHSQAVEEKFKDISTRIRSSIEELFAYLQTPQSVAIFGQLGTDVDKMIADLPNLTEEVNAVGASLGQAALLADKFVKAMDWMEKNLRPGDSIVGSQGEADLINRLSNLNVKPGDIVHTDWITGEWTRPDPSNPNDPVNFAPGHAPPSPPPAPAAPATAPATSNPFADTGKSPPPPATGAVDPVVQAEMDKMAVHEKKRQADEQFIAKELHIHVSADISDSKLGKLLKEAMAKAQADAKAKASAASIGGSD